VKRSVLTFALVAMGCGSNLMDEPIQFSDAVPPPKPVAQAPKPVPPPGSLFRKDVTRTIDEGLGYFLQRVSVDADVNGGKFHGFRIVELRPPEYWRGVDLQPGDVVTLVNGMPIERDIDAYEAFQALRVAPELKVTLFRAGLPRELVYSIIDPDATAAAKPAAVAPAPGSAPPPAPAKASSAG
jgi:type II secretory pathway component PulC